jgi:hypothetical protein
MDFELGNVIAERSLEAVGADGGNSHIRILLGTPASIPGTEDVYAPYQIEYAQRTRLWRAAGIDGFQALQLALRMIIVEIESLEREQGFNVVWGKDLI